MKFWGRLVPSLAFTTVISVLFLASSGLNVWSYNFSSCPLRLTITSTLYCALAPSISPVYPVLNDTITLEPCSFEYALNVFWIPLNPLTPLAIFGPSSVGLYSELSKASSVLLAFVLTFDRNNI